jgi:hypothetical protein
MIFLVALSGFGVIVAAQQYGFVHAQKEIELARLTLDESFLSSIQAAGGESNPEISQRLAHRKTILEGTYSSAATVIRQIEVRAIADLIGWCVVLGLSGWVLIITTRKKPNLDDPPAVASNSED